MRSAYWLTVTNQRWLGIRLDFLGILLTFVVAILSVAARYSISPSQMGVVLSYIISVQQAFGWLVRQTAEVENDFNSVERVVGPYFLDLARYNLHTVGDRSTTRTSSSKSRRTTCPTTRHRRHGHPQVPSSSTRLC